MSYRARAFITTWLTAMANGITSLDAAPLQLTPTAADKHERRFRIRTDTFVASRACRRASSRLTGAGANSKLEFPMIQVDTDTNLSTGAGARQRGGTSHGVLRPAADVVARRLGDSAVLIRLNTNRIYELNATGARVWELLSEGATRERVVDTLNQEFDDPGIGDAVDQLIAVLRSEGLV